MLDHKVKTNDAIQVLRGFAAVSVVVHHAFVASWTNAPVDFNRPLWHYHLSDILASGVDMFFILSGFLMVQISEPYSDGRRTPLDFLLRRLIRIWPAYAIATLLVLSLEVYSSDGSPVFNLEPTRLLSLAFIPSFDAYGRLQPIIGPGWTLNYEMLFYLIFAFALLISKRNILTCLTIFVTSAFIIGAMFPGKSVINVFLFNPIIFEFLIGAYIARLNISGTLKTVPPLIYILAGLVSLIGFAWVSNESEMRVFVRGLPNALIFCGVILYGNNIRWPRILKFSGDASYSIYLVHIPIIYGLLPRIMYIVGEGWESVFLAVSIYISLAIGVLYYIIVEKPLRKSLERFHERSWLRSY